MKVKRQSKILEIIKDNEIDTQEALAEKAGLHRTYISAIECGRRSISSITQQRRI